MTDDTPTDNTVDEAALDMGRLVTEINEEVERRRASGDLPPEFERELDRTFAEYAPVDAIDADFDSIVAKIERSAVIDVRPSTVSAYPGASQMKQVVAKATAFYVRHVATQASGLFQALARALRLLSERVERLEADRDSGDLARWRQLEVVHDAPGTASVSPRWDDYVVGKLGGATGRVLHAHAGDGRLVRRLLDAGIDAYGVDPSEEATLVASDLVPDVRAVALAEHLATLPPESLGGLVLTGLVERLDAESLMGLGKMAHSRLRPGATLVVVSAHPAAWLRLGPPLAVDLATGRPLHPETWLELLGRVGFTDLTAQAGAGPQLVRVPAEPEALRAFAEVCNENFARLAAALQCPAEFAVSGRRPS